MGDYVGRRGSVRGENGLFACGCEGNIILTHLDEELGNLNLQQKPEQKEVNCSMYDLEKKRTKARSRKRKRSEFEPSSITVLEVGSGGMLGTSLTIKHVLENYDFHNVNVILSEHGFHFSRCGIFHLLGEPPPDSRKLALADLAPLQDDPEEEEIIYFTKKKDSFAKFSNDHFWKSQSNDLSTFFTNIRNYAETSSTSNINVRLTGDILHTQGYENLRNVLGEPTNQPLLFFTSHLNPTVTYRLESQMRKMYSNFHSFHVNDRMGRNIRAYATPILRMIF